jgi:hypothetical protein
VQLHDNRGLQRSLHENVRVSLSSFLSIGIERMTGSLRQVQRQNSCHIFIAQSHACRYFFASFI